MKTPSTPIALAVHHLRPATSGSIPGMLLAIALALLAPGFSRSASAATPVPFKGSMAGKALGVPASGTNPYLYTGYVWGSGPSTLGKARVAGYHTTYADTGAIVNGLLAFAIADGTILATYSGAEQFTLDPTVFAVVGDITFTGGTGRYRDASGGATFSGDLKILSISATGVFDETIRLSYGGTLRIR